MTIRKELNKIRFRRTQRARAKIFGISAKPRLSVFRSNYYTYAQLIDDEEGKTLASASTKELKNTSKDSSGQKQAELLGELIAQKATGKGIGSAIFDRRQYKYHGRIKAVAEGARKGGLKI